MHPQQNSRGAWPSNDDQTMFNLIVIFVGVLVASYLLWTNFHGEISGAVMAVRHQEMQLLDHLTDKFENADRQMAEANPYRVTLRDLYGISHAIGCYWRIPAFLFMVLLAFLCMARAAPSRFKRAFDIEGLAKEQAAIFPCTAAFLDRKLTLTLPSGGEPLPTDYALTAEEWIDRFALNDAGDFDQGRARTGLARQLGPRWFGPDTARPHAKILFAAFALHHNEKRQDAIDLLAMVSVALAKSGTARLDRSAKPLAIPSEIVAHAMALMADPDAFKASRQAARAHAYTAPALMTVLNQARRCHGVLAPAQFAWLKLVDRPLWYALHSLGFETEGVGRYLHPNPRVEAVGVRDHWAVECAAGEPVIEASCERALAALTRHAPSSTPVQPFVRPRADRTADPAKPVRSRGDQSPLAQPKDGTAT